MVVCSHRCWEPNACPLRERQVLFEPSLQLSYLREQANQFFYNSARCSEWVFIQDHLKALRNDDMVLLSGIKMRHHMALYIHFFIYVIVLVCFSIAVIKDSYPKQLGEKKVLFSLQFVESERKPRQEPELG